MKKRLCLLALCLAALLGLSLFFVACDDEPAPGPTPAPVEHTHSYTSVTIAMADYMSMDEANAGKFIKDVAVPCSGEDCDSTLTLTKDELNAVLVAIEKDEDAADYTAKVEGGNYVASFKVTKGEYTVTVNVTQPHTHIFLETTISFDEYIDEETGAWKKPLEVPCFDSPIGCTGKLTFTVEELNNQSENFEQSGELGYGTLTKDGHTVTVTVTGVPASEDPGPDEPMPPAPSPFSITVKIGQAGLVDDATYTYCVGTTVAYTVTVTDRSTGEVVMGEDLQYLSATYQIGDGVAVDFTQQAADFTFATVGTYTIVVTYDNGVDEPADFTCTVEVSEHEGTYHAATSATCTEDGTVAYVYCSECRKYFKVTGTADDYTIGEEFDYNNGEGIINQEDPAKGHSYTAVTIAMADYIGTAGETRDQFIKDVSVPCDRDGCDSTLTLTKETINQTMAETDVSDVTIIVKDGNDMVIFDVTEGEYTVTVNVTQPHTHLFETTISCDEYIDMENETWRKGLEVTCAHSIRGCTGKLTFTVEELNAQMEQEPVQVDETTVQFTLTKDDHTVTVTVTGVPMPTPQAQYTVGLNIGENAVNSGESSTICVGSSVAYAVTMTKDGSPVADVAAEAIAAGLSAFYTIGDGNSTSLTAVSGNFTFDQTGTYVFTISVTGSTFTYTVEVQEHTWAYTASNGEGHYRACSVCGYEDEQLYNHEGQYAYDAEKGAVVFTCSVCKGTVDCTITGISVTAETGAYIVDNGDGTYTAYGFTVEAVYEGVSGNKATEIIIPAEDWTATPQGSYKAAVEFAFGTLKDKPDGTFAVYADELDPLPGAQTLSGYQPTAITLGSFKGEFVYHIELDGTVAETASYESWLIQVTAGNGALAVLRADNYVLDNFGRKADELGADVNELDSFVGTGDPIRSGDIVIDIVRTFDVASGIYKLEFTVTDGTNVSTYTITEPATNGNSVTVYLGGENCSYTVAGALYAEKGLTVKSVQAPAEPINVSGGTSLTDALQNVTVTVSYTESTLTDTVAASACDPVCADYDADTTGDYIVTLTYGGKTTQVTIHVDAEHVHAYTNFICACGAVDVAGMDAIATTPHTVTNSDTSEEWWEGGNTADIATVSGDFAIKMTFANTGDPGTVLELQIGGDFFDFNVAAVEPGWGADDMWGALTTVTDANFAATGVRPTVWDGNFTVYLWRDGTDFHTYIHFEATDETVYTVLYSKADFNTGDAIYRVVGNPYGKVYTVTSGTIA